MSQVLRRCGHQRTHISTLSDRKPSCQYVIVSSGTRGEVGALLLTLLSAAPSHQTSVPYATAAPFRKAIFEPDLVSTFTNHPPLDPGLVSPAKEHVLTRFYFRLQNITAVPPLFFRC